MLSILATLGIGITRVISDISKEKSNIENAKTERERIASQERLGVLEARKEVILNAKPLDIIIKSLYGLLPIPYFAKIFVYDKFIMADWVNGRTDDLSTDQWWMVTTIIGGYFLIYTIEKFRK